MIDKCRINCNHYYDYLTVVHNRPSVGVVLFSTVTAANMAKTLYPLLLIGVFLAQRAYASPAKSDEAASATLPNWLQDIRDAIEHMLGIESGKSIKTFSYLPH